MKTANVFTVRVESIDPNTNGLNVRLPDTDEIGFIPADEITRSVNRINPSRLCGKLLHVCKKHLTTDDGKMIFSSKAYEDDVFDEIRRQFDEGIRNTYPATFRCLSKKGDLALYEIDQGIVGAVPLKQFCFNYIDSFIGIALPESLPVSIVRIDQNGKIFLSTVAAFGSFRQNVEYLGLEPGVIAEGYAACALSGDSGVLVQLAPNLSTIVNWAPLDRPVHVRINSIDFDSCKIKADYIEPSDHPLRKPEEFVFDVTESFVDSDAFLSENKPKKTKKDVLPESGIPDDDELQVDEIEIPSFDFLTDVSPFRIVEGETVHRVIPNHIPSLESGISSGKLTARHRELAEAVDHLKYTTADHLFKYLYLTGHPLSEDTVRNRLKVLCKYNVLNCIHLTPAGGTASGKLPFCVYARGQRYKKFTSGRYHCYNNPGDLLDGASTDPVKERLALNNLLLGSILNCPDTEVVYGGHFEPCEEDASKFYPNYLVTSPDLGKCWLESCRRGGEPEMLDRLKRFGYRLTSDCTVAVTFEDEEHAAAFAEEVSGLHLGYTVRLTWDLHCFKPGFPMEIVPSSVPATDVTVTVGTPGSGSFNTVRRLIREQTDRFLSVLFA